jgi:hypothetical protein
MFKYLLSLTFAVGLASAATISTSATCDGVTTVGTFSASCNDGRFAANAFISAPLIVSDTVSAFSVLAHAGAISGPPPLNMGEASANFSDEYVFTLNGGTGDGFFFPVFSLSEDSGTVGATFAGLETGCTPSMTVCMKPFTFGVPQIVGIDMTAVADGVETRVGDASVFFDGIAFFDPSGNPLSNVTFTLVEVPEPSAWSLLGVGLMFFGAVRIRAMRFRGRSY